MAIQVTGSPDPELIKQYYMRDPYREFLAREGIPIVEEYSVDCVNMPLEPWPRMGGLGAYVHLAGRGEFLSTYVSEIPPGGQLNVEQHLYDESIYVVKGRGQHPSSCPTAPGTPSNGRKAAPLASRSTRSISTSTALAPSPLGLPR